MPTRFPSKSVRPLGSAVPRLADAPTQTPKRARPKIGPDIIKEFGDGKWHRAATIAVRFQTDVDEIDRALSTMWRYPTFGARAERKRVGTDFEYRIWRHEKTVSAGELTNELAPIIEALEAEGRKTLATISPNAVAILAHRRSKLLWKWTS
jgi:hypothetical protein